MANRSLRRATREPDAEQRYRAHADVALADLGDSGPVVVYHRPSHCTVVINRHGYEIIQALQACERALTAAEIAARMPAHAPVHLGDALRALAERGLVVEV